MKTLVLFFTSFCFLDCVPNFHKNNLFSSNVYGEIVIWKQFPIVLQFHKDFPPNQKEIFSNEILKVNNILKRKVFVIGEDSLSEIDLTSRVTKNVIYWGDPIDLNIYEEDNARSSKFWVGNEIQNATLRFNRKKSLTVDFPTLVRHELAHTLGLLHSGSGLMNPHLAVNEIHEWGNYLLQIENEMIQQKVWKK